MTRVVAGSIARVLLVETGAGELRQRASQFDPGGSASDDHKGKPGDTPGWVFLALRLFEREQHAAAHRRRILDALKPRSVSGPFVSPEITVSGTGRDNEVVERDAFRGQKDLTRRAVDTDHLAETNGHVSLVSQDAADGDRDIGRRQAPRLPPGREAAGTDNGCVGR